MLLKRTFLLVLLVFMMFHSGQAAPQPSPDYNGSPPIYPLKWSPNANWVAYVYHARDSQDYLAVLNVSTGQVHMLFRTLDIGTPHWSPDSEHILFRASEGTQPGLYITDLAGNSNLLLDNSAIEGGLPMIMALEWTDDNRQLRVITGYGIYSINSDGSDLQQVTIFSPRYTPSYTSADTDYLGGMSVSPNRRYRAFIGVDEEKAAAEQTRIRTLYLMDVDGDHIRSLSDDLEVSTFTWSPDSRMIAFESSPDSDIYVVDIENPIPINLTSQLEDWAHTPLWTSDGHYILFQVHVNIEPVEFAIYRMEADGSALVKLTPDGEYNLLQSSSLSPDGQQIAFLHPGGSVETEFMVYVMDVGGGERQKVAELGQFAMFEWSPDGEAVAVNHHDGRLGVYYLNGSSITVEGPSAAYSTEQGVSAGLMGDSEQAFAHFDAAIEINPDYPLVYLARATEYMRLGQVEEATADYWQWITMRVTEFIRVRRAYRTSFTVTMTGGSAYQWPFEAQAGQVLTVTAEPAGGGNIDPLLLLLNADGEPLIADDDSGGDLKAYIRDFIIPADGSYTLIITHGGAGGRGNIDVLITLENEGE